MQLHDNAFSPYAFKVRAVLYEKRAEFTKCEIERAADRESLLRLNPRGEVPVLVDGDAVLCDSKVICAYLEERFPEPELIPKEPVLRARCRYLELKSDTELDACVFVLAILKLTRPDALAASPEALTRATELLSRLYGVWERELAGRDWLLGAFSLVDIALAPHVRAAAFLGHPPGEAHPGLSAWLSRIKQRPSLRQATREMGEAFAKSQSAPDSMFDPARLHWRNDRIETAVRCGLGPWLLSELETGAAFLSSIKGG